MESLSKVDNLDHMQLPEILCRIRERIKEGFNLLSWATFILLYIDKAPLLLDKLTAVEIYKWEIEK